MSWTPVNTGLTGFDASFRILLSVSRRTGVVYAMSINTSGMLDGVFRSANGGATWTAMGVPTPAIFPGGQGIVHGSIAADPFDPNIVYIGGDRQDFPFPNANGCNNFSANTFRGNAALASPWENVVCNGAQGTSPHADSRDMEFDTNGNLLHANDGGIYSLNNPAVASRQWVSLNGNLRPTEMHSAAFDAVTKTALGGTQDTGPTMQNAPGSRTWTEFLQGDGGVVAVDDTSAGVRDLVMDPQNIRHIYVVDELSLVWASFDEGLTWRNLTGNLPKFLGDARTIELIRPASSRKGVLVVGGLGVMAPGAGCVRRSMPVRLSVRAIPLLANPVTGIRITSTMQKTAANKRCRQNSISGLHVQTDRRRVTRAATVCVGIGARRLPLGVALRPVGRMRVRPVLRFAG